MNCSDTWTVLADISAGKQVNAQGAHVAELMAMGLIAPIKANGDGTGSRATTEMETMRNRLEQIAGEKYALNEELERLAFQDPYSSPSALERKFPHYGEKTKRLEALEAEERQLRTRFVNVVQASVEKVPRATLNGEAVHLTYRGREVMTILGQRMSRVAQVQLQAFVTELDDINAHFEERAVKARKILELLSPMYKQTDEIHLRLVSVGLSGRQGSAEEAVGVFSGAFRSTSTATFMDAATAMLLAEVLTLRSRDLTELNSLVQKTVQLIVNPWFEGQTVSDDQIRAAAIIMASGQDPDTLVEMTRSFAQSYCPSSLSAAAVLASATDPNELNAPPEVQDGSYNPEPPKYRTIERFLGIYQQIHNDLGDVIMDSMSAALMAASGMPIPDVLDRFGRAFQILDKFNGGSMRVPSAMVSILPTEVDEAMDNVRLASAAVMRNKLSLGGAENLSLGIKMLVHSAAIATGSSERKGGMTRGLAISAPSVLALTGIGVATAFALGASLLAFHEFSLHRIAVRDWSFHPVHSHYVYG